MRIASHPLGALPSLTPRQASWNPELNDALSRVPAVLGPDALVVTTGQQPGLFTGPIYTVHKALAAAALARELSERWRRPVVPVFWVAGDDADFAEASHASWLAADETIVEWRLPERAATAPQRAMSQEALPPVIATGLAELERTLPAGVARDSTMQWLRRHYVAGATLHRAAFGALAELLEGAGPVCIDPTHPTFKRAQAPLLRRALHRARELDDAVAAQGDVHTGIAAGQGATLVLLDTPGGRERLMFDDAGFRTRRSGLRFSAAALDALLDREPERFSANVLLRPVIESALLPTVAYVAGPAEYRYLTAQSSVLYPLLDVERQRPVPRWSGTVIPHWADRLRQRLGLTEAEILGDTDAVGSALLIQDYPPEIRMALDTLRQQLRESGSTIRVGAPRVDPVLSRAMDGRLRRLDQVTDDIERVLQRHLRKRADTAYAQWARLRTVVRPRSEPQERVFTAATFLGRDGNAWMDAVIDETRAWAAQLPDGVA